MKRLYTLCLVLTICSMQARADTIISTQKAVSWFALNEANGSGASGGETSHSITQGAPGEDELPAVAMFPYLVEISDISEYDERDKKGRSGRRDSYRASRSLSAERIGAAVTRRVAEAVRKTKRFAVREAAPPTDWYKQAMQKANRASLDGDFLLGGSLKDACILIRRKGDKNSDSWEVEVSANLLHEARTRDGEVWRNAETSARASRTFYSVPSASDLERLVEEAAVNSAGRWARLLVVEKRGRVIARNGNRVTIDLGSADGVGMDTDFVFQRPEEATPTVTEVALSATSAPTATGMYPDPNLLYVVARPDPKHPNLFPITARPAKVEEHTCEVELGYNGSGGLFGPDIKWKPRNEFVGLLRDGDIAVLTPRPFTAK